MPYPLLSIEYVAVACSIYYLGIFARDPIDLDAGKAVQLAPCAALSYAKGKLDV
jgi:hypothetical protein